MSKKTEKDLQRAAQYIREKKYAEARTLLKKINDPQAQEWLLKLDQIAPIKKKRGLGRLGTIGIGVGGCIGLIVCLVIGQSIGIIPNDSETKTAEAREREAARSTDQFIEELTATIIALTPSSTPTASPTPTNTPLPSDTPRQSATPAPSFGQNTLPPTWTPAPSSTSMPTSDYVPTTTRYTTQQINVRNGPGVDNERIGSLPAGYKLAVLGEQGGWYQIEFNDGVGWVTGEFTSRNPPPPISNNNPPGATSESPPVAACSCTGPDLDCGNFATHNDAQACYNYCMVTVGSDVHRLDGEDNDGFACELLP